MSGEGSLVLDPPLDTDRYKELVDRCARERLDYLIPNGSPQHARLLIAKLFETARKTALVISGKLTDRTTAGEDIYGHPEVITHALHFLRRPGTSLKIVVDGRIDRETQNRLLQTLVQDSARRGVIQIYYASGALAEAQTAHFMVTDALAYRYEPFADTAPDQRGIKAVANFGDEVTAKLLTTLYNQISSYLQSIRMPVTFSPGAEFILP